MNPFPCFSERSVYVPFARIPIRGVSQKPSCAPVSQPARNRTLPEPLLIWLPPSMGEYHEPPPFTPTSARQLCAASGAPAIGSASATTVATLPKPVIAQPPRDTHLRGRPPARPP